MGIIFFILIAGAWAAFLLPSFFDHRRENPRATTRAFARSKETGSRPYRNGSQSDHRQERL